jgi:acyl-CoA thioester hydrolase
MTVSNNTFSYNRRIYYANTDAGGIVYYGAYLTIFEEARTEWLRSYGFDQSILAEQYGVLFLVKKIQNLDFIGPARLDDLLTVDCKLAGHTKVSISIEQTAKIDGSNKLLVKGSMDLVCIDAISHKLKRIPQAIIDILL